MDKPPKFKSELEEQSDIKLKVSGAADLTSAPEDLVRSSDVLDSSREDLVSPSEDSGSDSDLDSGSSPDDASSSQKQIANALQTLDERVSMPSLKRAKEQEFLQAYKAKQLKTRLKFVAFAIAAFAIYISGVYFIFNDNEKAASALKKFQIAPLFACLGERDIAHYTMTEFSDSRTKDTPNLLETRTKILDNSIAEMEKSGKPAIFTRLGAEQMLMKFGDRATGLKFGDPLIARYPALPSNYFWRAKIDFETMNYVNSVSEYNQAAEKLANLPAGEKQDWQNQLSKGVWAAIFSGQSGEADKFLALYKKSGGNDYEFYGLQSEILLRSCSDIAAPVLKTTPFWNKQLAAEYESRLDKAVSSAKKMSYSDVKFDTLPDVFKWELIDQAALLSTDNKRIADYLDHTYGSQSDWGTTMRAKAALNRNSAQEAIALNAKQARSKYRTFRKEQEFIEASSLQKLGRPQEAIRLIDKFLNLKASNLNSDDDDDYEIDASENRTQTIANHYNQVLLTVKANALCDLGQYKKSIALCKAILAQNSHLIEPRLILLHSYQEQKDTKSAAEEADKISSELANWMNFSRSTSHD